MKKHLNSVEEVVKALKEGKKVSIKNANCKYIMENGLICRLYSDGQKVINAEMHLTSENKFYTEEPEPLKFKVDKAYKTKGGYKAFLDLKTIDTMAFLCDNAPSRKYSTDITGKTYSDMLESFDIVGYWEEEK